MNDIIGMHFSYRFGQWPTEVWGVFLFDIMRKIVESEVEENQIEPKQAIRTIMDRFIDEVNQFGDELGFPERNE